jgi:hypothetical protein
MKPSCALADLARETPLSIATMEESNRSPKKGLEEEQSGLRVYLSIRGRGHWSMTDGSSHQSPRSLSIRFNKRLSLVN